MTRSIFLPHFTFYFRVKISKFQIGCSIPTLLQSGFGQAESPLFVRPSPGLLWFTFTLVVLHTEHSTH